MPPSSAVWLTVTAEALIVAVAVAAAALAVVLRVVLAEDGSVR